MAIDADSYANRALLESLIGDIPVNTTTARTFSTTTVPTIVQAETFIDITASELNVALANSEYAVPVVVSTDKAAFNWLKYANACGAAVLVLDMMPTESYAGPNEEMPATGRKQHFQQVYLAALTRIKAEGLVATRSEGGNPLDAFKLGSEFDADGNSNKAIFKRDMFDYPSSRSLSG